MTALGALSPPENPEKGEKLPGRDRCPPFPPFPPFSGPGTTERATLSDSAATALATVRSYKRQAPPEPPRKLRLAAHGASGGVSTPAMCLPGVPPDWCEGVVLYGVHARRGHHPARALGCPGRNRPTAAA